jgi:CheY-like chemotaxis protein
LQQDHLVKVTQASKHLLHVINDILDISKIEAERLTLEQVDFKLSSILGNLNNMVAQSVANKGLNLMIEVAPELASQLLRGDPLRLGQILFNLTSNAIKFTETGLVTLRAQQVEASPNDILLRFEVQDSGLGISAADQKRLFTAFEQADGSMTRKYGGTGLGLVISKRLVQMMGGNIGVESQIGQGSTFWFSVRLAKRADPVVAAPEAGTVMTVEEQLKTRYSGSRILLTGDELINQEVFRELLEDVGLTVDLAEDGMEAVALAQRTRYDLILMDTQMQKLSAIDATRAIRALPEYEQTPILAMTASAFDEGCQDCLTAGMNDHIGKPVDPELLFETLLKWLESASR